MIFGIEGAFVMMGAAPFCLRDLWPLGPDPSHAFSSPHGDDRVDLAKSNGRARSAVARVS